MFAGGRFEQWAPVPFGCKLASRAAVSDVTVKEGRSGEMAFVTVRTELSVDGLAVAVEEQDIVYRSEHENAEPRVAARPVERQPAPAGEWRRTLATDPVLLARFSALTYTGHRIHYDQPYATGVEGYPDLVVHGPLLALLALELPRTYRPRGVVRSISYRPIRPAFVPSVMVAAGTASGDDVGIAIPAQGASPSLTATVRLG